MKEGDDWMLQSPRRVVTEILEAGVIHERTRRVVHIPPQQSLSVTENNTNVLWENALGPVENKIRLFVIKAISCCVS